MIPALILGAFLASLAVTPLVRWFAFRCGVIDQPGGRHIHRVPTALWGGLATGSVFIAGIVAVLLLGPNSDVTSTQLMGFIAAICIMLVGGLFDDRYDMPPAIQFLFPFAASLVVVMTGSSVTHVTNFLPSGVLSAFVDGRVLSLEWWTLARVTLPADLVTVVWLLVVTYAMKLLDGLDGLVAGMTVIGGVLIALLARSPLFFQPMIALLALMLAATYLGFLPYNKSGSLFLGESGSLIAGFSLGMLAIISGAKVATAASALAVPLVDVVLVVVGRLWRGASPFRGDNTHLHFRLLRVGLSPRNAVRVIWGLSFVFGLMALTLQTRGKVFLLICLVVFVGTMSYWAWGRAKNE